MDDLSTLAVTLYDRTLQVAEYYQTPVANELHLLEALRAWQPDRFDRDFPNLGTWLQQLFRKNRGAYEEAAELDEDTYDRLCSIVTPEDAWRVAHQIASIVIDLIDRLKLDQPRRAKPDESVQPLDTIDSEFSISSRLIARIAQIMRVTPREVWASLLSDGYAAAYSVVGDRVPDLYERLQKASGHQSVEFEKRTELSTMVQQLTSTRSSESGRTASQLAVALVEIAEWAATLAPDVERRDTDVIDLLRLDLRQQLGRYVNPENVVLTEFEDTFSNIVGMESVKRELRRLLDHLVATQRRQRNGLPTTPHRLHLAFTGNPGTGKTTVARLYGRMLHKLGLMPTDAFVEVGRNDLIGRHLGESETKVMDAILEADGGVLFIDEAYALHQEDDGFRDFGKDVLNVLTKELEDRRDRLVVIFAGYADEMEQMLRVNPGLRTRIGLTIAFPDYRPAEMAKILERIVERQRLTLDHGVAERLLQLVYSEGIDTPGFGNARTVENVLDTAHRNTTSRLAHLGPLATEAELSLIKMVDVPKRLG